MYVLFGAQDVLDLIDEDYIPIALPENEKDGQKNDQCDLRKKDYKALFYIQ